MWKTANQLMFVITIGVVAWQLVYWYGRLPDMVPSHFDLEGNVDDEMPKTSFMGLMLLLHAMFLFLIPLIGIGIGKVPDAGLNIPNKEYWLAPERRDETLGRISVFMLTIGWVSSWLVIGITHISSMVAIKARQNANPDSYILLGVYMALIFGLIGLLLWQYRIPSEANLENKAP